MKLSLLGVRDYMMGVDLGFGRTAGNPIDRDALVIPEVMIEDFNVSLDKIIKPIFDTVWNAAGYARSLNYDLNGNLIREIS
jgi:hypothetical protein